MWHGGQLGSDGNIYAIPANAERVLMIDPVAQTVSSIGPSLQAGVCVPKQHVNTGSQRRAAYACCSFQTARFAECARSQVLLVVDFSRLLLCTCAGEK